MPPTDRADECLLERLSVLLAEVDPVPPTVAQGALDLFERYSQPYSDGREPVDARCRELGKPL